MLILLIFHALRVFTDKPEMELEKEATNLWFRIDIVISKNYS